MALPGSTGLGGSYLSASDSKWDPVGYSEELNTHVELEGSVDLFSSESDQ